MYLKRLSCIERVLLLLLLVSGLTNDLIIKTECFITPYKNGIIIFSECHQELVIRCKFHIDNLVNVAIVKLLIGLVRLVYWVGIYLRRT